MEFLHGLEGGSEASSENHDGSDSEFSNFIFSVPRPGVFICLWWEIMEGNWMGLLLKRDMFQHLKGTIPIIRKHSRANWTRVHPTKHEWSYLHSHLQNLPAWSTLIIYDGLQCASEVPVWFWTIDFKICKRHCHVHWLRFTVRKITTENCPQFSYQWWSAPLPSLIKLMRKGCIWSAMWWWSLVEKSNNLWHIE